MYEYGQNRAKNRRSRPRRREGRKHEWSKIFNKGVQLSPEMIKSSQFCSVYLRIRKIKKLQWPPKYSIVVAKI